MLAPIKQPGCATWVQPVATTDDLAAQFMVVVLRLTARMETATDTLS
jgi:hypothetical protein